MPTPEIVITVLCPTRKRPDLLRRSYASLIHHASVPESIEFLAAIDPDDAGECDQPWDLERSVWWTAPERYGYSRLHEYYNRLAAVARGRWLMLWNDDAMMMTDDWDLVITGQPARRLLWMTANHHCTGNLFPVWPKAWTDAMGHVSLSPNVDRWLTEIARMQGVEFRIPVNVFHERADVTGLNWDQTYLEGRHLMGAGEDHSDFGSLANREARARDIRVIDAVINGEPLPR